VSKTKELKKRCGVCQVRVVITVFGSWLLFLSATRKSTSVCSPQGGGGWGGNAQTKLAPSLDTRSALTVYFGQLGRGAIRCLPTLIHFTSGG